MTHSAVTSQQLATVT